MYAASKSLSGDGMRAKFEGFLGFTWFTLWIVFLCLSFKVRPFRLKPAETGVESALVSSSREPPYGPLVPLCDRWGRPSMHHSTLRSIF